jgi:hypothetical protein
MQESGESDMSGIVKKTALVMGLLAGLMVSTPGHAAQFMARDHLVIDLLHGVEWLRCSVGQTWNGTACAGKVLNLDHSEIEQAIEQANQQLGGSWRLPSREELLGLVCESCPQSKIDEVPKARIDQEIFPATDPAPYWTGEKNRLSLRHFWAVNFYTGFSFGRFFPTQKLAVRLVRDRGSRGDG